MNKPTVWTVITKAGYAWTHNKPNDTYFTVLMEVNERTQTGGSQHDRDDMLMIDGVIVVQSGLSDIAYKYFVELRKAQAEATREVNARFSDGWLIAKNTADAKRN